MAIAEAQRALGGDVQSVEALAQLRHAHLDSWQSKALAYFER